MRFKESQQFPGWLRYGILLFTLVLLCNIIQSSRFSYTSIIIPIIFLCIPNIITFWTQVTEIDTSNIYIKVKPFINKQIPFSQIESWAVRTYKPIAEYGGWGIRFGRNGTAYNIRGNKGLQLYLTGGRKILIGTQKEAELQSAMKSLCPQKEKPNNHQSNHHK